ncbi:MAG: SCO family protein [Thermoanaerobaculia bacterium]
MIRKSLALIALVASFAISAAGQDFLAKDGPITSVRRQVGIDQKLNNQVPLDLPFVDDQGHAVKLGDYFGKRPVLLVPVYYKCPMLCNMVLQGVVDSVRDLRFNAGDEYEVVVFSFDPSDTTKDAAEKKRTYVQRYGRAGTEHGWHFLTGSQDSITRLTDAIGFRYYYDAKRKQFAHGAAIMLLTAKGKLSRYYYGIQYNPRDLRLGMVETANDKIGSPVDQLLLLCYCYDPATGKYSSVAVNTIRAGGVATLVLLGGTIFFFLRRDKKTQAS